jgi:hypothetical protein
MMKKLLILMLVLGLASVANAVTVSIVSKGSSAIDANAGDTVYVDVVCDTAVTVNFTASFMETTTSAAGNSTSTAGSLDAGFTSTVSSNGGSVDTTAAYGAGTARYILVHRVNGVINTGDPAVSAGTKLYKDMAITLPALAALGDTFTIDFAVGYKTVGGPPAYSQLIDNAIPDTRNALTITIVPEPMTILLLGLGGLCLRRRK